MALSHAASADICPRAMRAIAFPLRSGNACGARDRADGAWRHLAEEMKKRPRKPLHVMAYGVHVVTALGAALGFLAMKAALLGQLSECFWWLAAALVVDAADGPMARRLNVSETASRYDGEVLDLVVDFITYVFVPAAILLRSEVMSEPFGLIAGMIITIGSALYFADTGMKTEDWWFKGFPAVWNVVIFYIVVFQPPTWIGFGIVVLFAAMMFLPVVFVHPVRVRRWRGLTMAVLACWAAAAAATLFAGLVAPFWAKAALLAGAAYFLGLGFLRDAPQDSRSGG
jgi:phosphatidylcholine synthase